MARTNKAIELLAQDQPVYLNIHYSVPLDHPYEAGVELARSWADLVDVDMERSPFSVERLAEFMRGMRAGGPTASGHPTPAVYVSLPLDGSSEAVIRANSWMIWQVLDTGVHGLMLCGAEDPGAVRAYVEAARYPFNRAGVGTGLGEGRRGRTGYDVAAGIWGISPDDYIHRADVWPLNPEGEIMLGIKVENKRALANCDLVTGVPGLAFAEWGPGDMSWSMGLERAPREPMPPQLADARSRIFAAVKSHKLAFLEGVRADQLKPMIDEGARIFCGKDIPEIMADGKKYTRRTMP